MSKRKNNTIAILDLGTSKIVCLIAKINSNGILQVLGLGHNLSNGIKAGIITAIEAAEKAISTAIEAAEKASGESIEKVYINIPSSNLLSQRLRSELLVTGHEINDKDLSKLLFQVLDKYDTQNFEVLHTFPYDYTLDGNSGIRNPLNMFGDRLSASVHLISVPATIILNLANCLARCQVEVQEYLASAYMLGMLYLTEDEREMGAVLLELGAGCTAISVFNHEQIIYTDSVPMGGMSITYDIARGLCIDFATAERLKIVFGGVMDTIDDHEVIELGEATDETTTKAILAEIIRARIEEILEIAREKLSLSGLEGVAGNRIVITGGGAQLNGIKELVAAMFNKKVRVASNPMIEGLDSSTLGLGFSTIIANLLYIAQKEESMLSLAKTSKKKGMFHAIARWFHDNIE